MIYNSKEKRVDYYPPLLSNCDITLYPDYEGSVCYTREDYPDVIGYAGRVFRAGRRQSVSHKQGSPAPLLWWGAIKFDCGSAVDSFTQELNDENGYIFTSCEYENKLSVDTTCFVHPKHNTYAIKKVFKGDCKNVKFIYTIDDVLEYEARSIEFTKNENSVFIDLDIKAYDTYFARIALTTNKEAKILIDKKSVTFEYSVFDGDEICFYYTLEDSLYCDNHRELVENVSKEAVCGFDKFLEETKKDWRDYHERGYIKTGDTLIDSVYRTAMYHLRCSTTRWSIAVGVNNMHWDSKFFAFDEYYSYLGLLESNKIEQAKRVPDFRLNVCLEKAITRATDYSKNPDVVQALFAWETGEHGEELARPGFWMDHIFHIAIIALGAFEYYEHTEDLEFLKECYPMIKACAKFYTLNTIYENSDGSLYVGKCTDLERLGSSVTNPFFTACGVIKTLEVLVKASELLDLDEEYRKECEYKEKKLRESLPNDGEKYIPFKGCEQKSIAVFAGKYPFNVIDNNDPKLLPALCDFVANEKIYGNMYPLGKKMSPWYASWKAVGFARMGLLDEAYKSIRQALESVGVFGDIYEINEEIRHNRPWFTTAAGVFSSALSEMLIQSDGENIYLLPASPDEFSTVSFKLSAKGGAIVEAEIENNEIKKLDITFKPTAKEKSFNVFLRGKKIN